MLKIVKEYESLWFLEKLAAAYESSHGAAPFDLSHWDPSEKTSQLLLSHLRLPSAPPFISYIYTYDLNLRAEIIRRLDIENDHQRCLVVPSGTSAIFASLWWLKSLGIDLVAVICPSYFSVFHACDILELAYTRIYMRRNAKEWSFPSDQIDLLVTHKPQSKAIWLTNPIYCTGVRQPSSLLPYIRSLLKQGVAVIIDECLCAPPYSLARQLHGEKFLSISSPHKTVCINALKFSTLVFDECHQHFFGSLSDILIGGLGASNYTAIQHFCDSNFTHVQSAFFSYIDDARQSVSQIADRYKPSIDFDKGTVGHYMTFYASEIKGDSGMDPHFLEELVYATGTSIIPGTINQFNPENELCFRVNLARSSTQLHGAFSRVLQYLANKS